jgi:pyruvate dehydrogenase E1 component beta subunit
MREITYLEAIREAMSEEMRKDEYLFLIGQDVGAYGGEWLISGDMHSEFGDWRVQDAPISEQAIVGCGIGASITGCKAIVEIPFNDFLPMCMDQICNQAAKFYYMFGGKINVPLVIRSAYGGFTTAGEQHSQSFEAWFTNVPGLKLVVPSTAYDAKGLLKTAINDKNPVLFFEHKMLLSVMGEVPKNEYTIPFGVADIKKEGNDITVIATSYMVSKALDVANKLEKKGISIEVVDPRTLVPLDKETIINSVKKTGRVVIVHESCKRGGIGGEIGSIIAEEGFDYLDAPIKRVGGKNTPIPFPSVLENYILPSENDIENAIKEII